MATKETPSPDIKTAKEQPNTLAVVWQWVCYGLWELSLVTLMVLLTSALVYFFVDGSNDYTFSVYFLAAMLCLLPPAFIIDREYQKREPQAKHGFAGVVMVLNAVVVFIAALAGFITAVMVALSILIDGDASAEKTVTIVTSLIVAKLAALLFIRIINPARWPRLVANFRYMVVATAVLALVLACAGPVRSLITTRDDRLIEDNLMHVQNAVDDYTYNHHGLPSDLSDVNTSGRGKAKRLVNENKVTYRANTKPAKEDTAGGATTTYYYYELCVTYKKTRGDKANWDASHRSPNYTYRVDHPAGEQCYDLEAYVYGN